jgi:hypothetical protein
VGSAHTSNAQNGGLATSAPKRRLHRHREVTVFGGATRSAAAKVPRTPSEALLIACARPQAVTKPCSEIADLAAHPDLEWSTTVMQAVWQGLAPRLARSLVVSDASNGVAQRASEQLQSAYLRTMARNLELRRELERAVVALQHAGIDVMLLKGSALVPLVHPDPGVRHMDDLDLLVHRGDLERAEQALGVLGYLPSQSPPAVTRSGPSGVDSAPHHDAPMVRVDGKVAIELHHKLGDSGSPLDFDVAGLWARAVSCNVGDADCLRPSNDDLLAHVCLHFLVDRVRLFSRRALGQLSDVAAMLAAFADTFDWDTATRNAVRRGYAAAFALALDTASSVLGIRAPAAVRGPLDSTSVALDGHEMAARRVLREPEWTTLELLTSRQPSVLHLLPPHPKRWSPRNANARPPVGALEGFARWATASGRLAVHPRELAAERRFAADLEALVYPYGRPDGSRSPRRVRRRLQASLARPVRTPDTQRDAQ